MKPEATDGLGPPLPLSYVPREACKQAIKLLVAVWLAAYFLHACKSVIGSIPLAIALVAAANWHLRQRGPSAGNAPAPHHPQYLARDILQGTTALAAAFWLVLDGCVNALFGGEGNLTWHAPTFSTSATARSTGLRGSGSEPAQRDRSLARQAIGHEAYQSQPKPAHMVYPLKQHEPRVGACVPGSDPRAAESFGAAGAAGGSRLKANVRGVDAVGGAEAGGSRLRRSNEHQHQHQHRAQAGFAGERTLSGRLSYDHAYGLSAGGSRGDGRNVSHAGTDGSAAAADEARPDHNAWRVQVGSKVVEFAWEKLCGGIVQTWLYDVWWAMLSPDREFPAEVRRLLNSAFGRLAERARRLDVAGVLFRDVCDALMTSLELYRATLEHLGGEQQLEDRSRRHAAQNLSMTSTPTSTAAATSHAHGHDRQHSDNHQQVAPASGSAAAAGGDASGGAAAAAAAAAAAVYNARERLLQGGLRACGALHPAFEEPEGHYRALRDIADGLVGVLWPGDPLCCGRLRPLVRELLSTCLLRPIMMMATTATAIRVLHGILPALPDAAPPTAAPHSPAHTAASSAAASQPSTAAAAAAPRPSSYDSSIAAADAAAGRPRPPMPPPASMPALSLSVSAGAPAVTAVATAAKSSARGTPSVAPESSAQGGDPVSARGRTAAGAVPPATAVAAAAAAEAEAELAARAASEASLEFDQRVAANAAAEASLLRRLGRHRATSSTGDALGGDRPLSRSQLRQHARSQQQLLEKPRHPAASPEIRLRHSATASPALAPQPQPSGGAGGGTGGGVRKSASTMDLRASAGGGATGGPGTSSDGADAGAPTSGKARVGPSAGASAGGSPGTDGRYAAPAAASTAQGLSASYHAGMDTAGDAGAPRRRGHSGQGHQGHGASAGASPEKVPEAAGARAGPALAVPSQPQGPGRCVHRRSCSYDTASARAGTDGGAAVGDVAVSRGGGGGGGGTSSFFKGTWFDFDLSLPWRPDAPQKSPPQERDCQQDKGPPQDRQQAAAFPAAAELASRDHTAHPHGQGPPLGHRHPHQQYQQQHSEEHRARSSGVPSNPDADDDLVSHPPARPPSASESRLLPRLVSDTALPHHPAPSVPAPTSAGGAAASAGAHDEGAPRRLRASVAAFEMVSEPLGFGLTAEYVVYKIRVADAASGREWTVARRFRTFEALATKLSAGWPRHRALVQSLPPKRIFVHTADVAFINSRRAELDAYLQQLLGIPELSASMELRDFLLPDAPSAAATGVRHGKTASTGASQPAPPLEGPSLRSNEQADPRHPHPHPHHHRHTASAAADPLQPGSLSPGPAASAARNIFERISSDLRGLRQSSRLRFSKPPAERTASAASSTSGRGGSVAAASDAAPSGAGGSSAFASWLSRCRTAPDPVPTGGGIGGADKLQRDSDDTRDEQSTAGQTETPEEVDGNPDDVDVYDVEYDDVLVEREASGGAAGVVGAAPAPPAPRVPGGAPPAPAAGPGYRLPGLANLVSGLPFARSPGQPARSADAAAGEAAPGPSAAGRFLDVPPWPLSGGAGAVGSGGGGGLAAGASKLVASLRLSGRATGGSPASGGKEKSNHGEPQLPAVPSGSASAMPLPLTPTTALDGPGDGSDRFGGAAPSDRRTAPWNSSDARAATGAPPAAASAAAAGAPTKGGQEAAVAPGALNAGVTGTAPRPSPGLAMRQSADAKEPAPMPPAPAPPRAPTPVSSVAPAATYTLPPSQELNPAVVAARRAGRNAAGAGGLGVTKTAATAGFAGAGGTLPGSRVVSVPNTPISTSPTVAATPPLTMSDVAGPGPASAAAAAAGVSAPLYELIDVLFGLQGQGFLRRQVIAVTRQMLSLFAGDAIDHYVSHQLRHLTSEHSLARALLMLHGALFPGGAWYSFGQPPQEPQPQLQLQADLHRTAGHQHPQHHAHLRSQSRELGNQHEPAHSASQRPTAGGGVGAEAGPRRAHAAGSCVPQAASVLSPAAAVLPGPRWRPSPPISADAFLEAAPLAPAAAAEAQQMADRVRARLFARSPAMLVNVVGARGYARVLGDVWGMLHSRTMMLQLAYSLLQTLLVRLFPELQPKLRHLQPRGSRRSALEGPAVGGPTR